MKLATVRPTKYRMKDPVDAWLNDFFVQHSSRSSRSTATKPAVNILEYDDKFVLELAAPGFSKSDFIMDVDDDKLTISAKPQEPKDKDQTPAKIRKRGFQILGFEKKFSLVDEIDQDKITAKYDQGILSVNLLKKVVEKIAPKKIEIG